MHRDLYEGHFIIAHSSRRNWNTMLWKRQTSFLLLLCNAPYITTATPFFQSTSSMKKNMVAWHACNRRRLVLGNSCTVKSDAQSHMWDPQILVTSRFSLQQRSVFATGGSWQKTRQARISGGTHIKWLWIGWSRRDFWGLNLLLSMARSWDLSVKEMSRNG